LGGNPHGVPIPSALEVFIVDGCEPAVAARSKSWMPLMSLHPLRIDGCRMFGWASMLVSHLTASWILGRGRLRPGCGGKEKKLFGVPAFIADRWMQRNGWESIFDLHFAGFGALNVDCWQAEQA